MDDIERYIRREIDDALAGTPEDHRLGLKLVGDQESSKFIRVSTRQARAIRELLATGDLEAVRRALTGEVF
jgi:hypothetical protein